MSVFQIAYGLVQRLKTAGYIAYFTGGWVRDFLLKRPSDDIDIATNATTDEIQKIFPHTIPVGIQFGIIIVVQDGHHFEVASFRKDKSYEDGRRPTGIDTGTAFEDAQRRDFTINGLFFDPISNELFDYVHGQKDLTDHLIRAIGNADERFREDRLRMMRAVRYATRFDFKIETSTQEAIIKHASELIPAVAVERIWQEFMKMHKFHTLHQSILQLHQLGLLGTIFPTLRALPIQEIRERIKNLSQFPAEAPLILCVLELFPEKELSGQLEIADFFKLPRIDREWIIYHDHLRKMIELSGVHLDLIEHDQWASIYAHNHFLLSFSILLLDYKEMHTPLIHAHTSLQNTLKEFIHKIKNNQPLIQAQDLMKEGIKPGKTMGNLLSLGHKIAINKKLLEPSLIIKELKKTALWIL